jgi:tRNA A37 threonylcarbamoyltransferase TsaD
VDRLQCDACGERVDRVARERALEAQGEIRLEQLACGDAPDALGDRRA